MERTEQSRFEKTLLFCGFILSAAIIAAAVYIYLDPQQAGLSYSDIGTFVGGISSFLAFLWLIITIFLQYRELRLQRQDLRIQIGIYEEQKAALVGSQKAAEKQLTLIKSQMDQQTLQFGFLLKNEQKAKRTSACHDLYAHILYTLIPSLRKVAIYSESLAAMEKQYGYAEQALRNNDLSICGRLVNEIVAHFPFSIDSQAIAELSALPNIKDYLLLLSALFTSVEIEYGDEYKTHQDTILLQFIERGLRELNRIVPELPSTGDNLSALIESLATPKS